MPCKIQLRQRITDDIDNRLRDSLQQTLDIAEQKAADINAIYGSKTVTIVDNNDHLDREINIPETVVDLYYDSELKMEKLTNSTPQQDDANRVEEDYTPDYLLQTNDMISSKSSTETLSKIKDAAKKMGINIQDLADYLKGNPNIDSKGINGIADLVKGVIAIAHGMENTTLTEEFVHIATSILEQTNPKLITELISKIDRFKIYKTVLESYGKRKEYQLSNGKPDIRKIKKEAIDKLLAEVIINNSENKTEFPELLEEKNISMIQQWWNTIKDYIRGIYRKTNIDIFNEVENKIINQTNIQNESAKIKSETSYRRGENLDIPRNFEILWDRSTNGDQLQLHRRIYNSVGSYNSDSIIGGVNWTSLREMFLNRQTLSNMERERLFNDTLISLIRSTYGNTFNKGVAKKLGRFSFIIIDNPRIQPIYTRDGNIFLNISEQNSFINHIFEYTKEGNEWDLLDTLVSEELIHLVSSKLTSPEETSKAYKELSQEDKVNILQTYYHNRNLVDTTQLKPYQYVHEYIRMQIQKKKLGKATEETRTTLYQMIQKVWDYLKDLLPKYTSLYSIYDKTLNFIETGEGNLNAPSEGILGLPQIRNSLVDKMYDKIIEMDNRLELHPESVNDKRHYTLDGQGNIPTVSRRVKEEGNKSFTRSEIDKLNDEQKREWGSEGHSLLENYITNNLIDKDGYKREVPLNVEITSNLNPIIQEKIKTFASELINSYPEGTRFIIERKVVNEKVKGMIASTVDFMAIEPSIKKDGSPDVKVDILDWKFTSINKNRVDDIPWFKKKEWKAQMGEYSKMMYNYGLKSDQLRKARMIPFINNYEYNIPGSAKSGLYLASVEIGKLNSLEETNLYLLPVPIETESTGVKKLDELVKSFNQYYEKLYKQPVSPEEKSLKNIRLNELSKAIRSLHMRLDFAPLANVGETFLKTANEAFKTLENIDYTTLTKDDINKKLGDLLEFRKSAEKFATLDEVFLSAFPKEGLTPDAKKVLASLERVASSTGRMMNKINELQGEYTIHFALKEGLTTETSKETILSPELEVKGLFKSLTEASKLSIRLVKLAVNLLLNTRSATNIKVNTLIDDFGKVLLPLEKIAKSMGKNAFDLIGKVSNGKLILIKKIDKNFYEQISLEKVAKNKQFFLDNMDLEQYNVLSKEALEKGTDEINRTQFSSIEQDDINRKIYEIQKLKDSLDINSETFNGYDDFHFSYLFRKTMKEEKHYSEEFKQMSKTKETLDVWNFFTSLNERAKQAGYLEKEGLSFFPLIEASMLQKLSTTNNLISEAGDLFEDLYKVRVNEEHTYSKTDPETGQPKKSIPRLFTRTDKQVHQLSRDLTKVGTLWIKSLLEYESARDMETTMLTLLSVEKAKGHLLTNENQELIWENGILKVDEKSNKNADILETIINDSVYGMHENLSSVGNISLEKGLEKISKDKETSQARAISIKKGIDNMNKLTQSLAVGLKFAVAIPNYFGNHFQSYINSGGLYKYSEYFKNHLKLITGVNLSTIEKGLLDMFVPLNGDIYEEKRRELAFKQGYIKWLGTWNMQEGMMSTNYLPERNLQFTNALSHIDNAMVRNGKIVNIRQFVKHEEQSRYTNMSQEERKSFEKGFEQRVSELKEKESLSKTAKIEGDKIVIPGVSIEEMAKFRTKMVEWGRNLNGQMSQENKADYRRDTLIKSMFMFRNWIPKQISVRGHDISKNLEIGQWEYGRTRAFMKTWVHLGTMNILKMRDIIQGTDKGLAILDEMLSQKKEDFYRKNGYELEITNEEFYDMMRQVLSNEMKELGTLLGLIVVVFGAKLAEPPKDDDKLTRNKYKYFAKIINKISNEVDFYYNPLSFVSMTKGNFLPSLGLLTKAFTTIGALGKETYGRATDNQEMIDKAQPTKYFLDMIPIASQFEREWLPLIDPELARSMGITVSPQARPGQ